MAEWVVGREGERERGGGAAVGCLADGRGERGEKNEEGENEWVALAGGE